MQPVVHRVDGSRNETFLIRVLDTQDQSAFVLASEEEVVERRAHAADVQFTGGRRSEANAHVGHEEQV